MVLAVSICASLTPLSVFFPQVFLYYECMMEFGVENVSSKNVSLENVSSENVSSENVSSENVLSDNVSSAVVEDFAKSLWSCLEKVNPFRAFLLAMEGRMVLMSLPCKTRIAMAMIKVMLLKETPCPWQSISVVWEVMAYLWHKDDFITESGQNEKDSSNTSSLSPMSDTNPSNPSLNDQSSDSNHLYHKIPCAVMDVMAALVPKILDPKNEISEAQTQIIKTLFKWLLEIAKFDPERRPSNWDAFFASQWSCSYDSNVPLLFRKILSGKGGDKVILSVIYYSLALTKTVGTLVLGKSPTYLLILQSLASFGGLEVNAKLSSSSISFIIKQCYSVIFDGLADLTEQEIKSFLSLTLSLSPQKSQSVICIFRKSRLVWFHDEIIVKHGKIFLHLMDVLFSSQVTDLQNFLDKVLFDISITSQEIYRVMLGTYFGVILKKICLSLTTNTNDRLKTTNVKTSFFGNYLGDRLSRLLEQDLAMTQFGKYASDDEPFLISRMIFSFVFDDWNQKSSGENNMKQLSLFQRQITCLIVEEESFSRAWKNSFDSLSNDLVKMDHARKWWNLLRYHRYVIQYLGISFGQSSSIASYLQTMIDDGFGDKFCRYFGPTLFEVNQGIRVKDIIVAYQILNSIYDIMEMNGWNFRLKGLVPSDWNFLFQDGGLDKFMKIPDNLRPTLICAYLECIQKWVKDSSIRARWMMPRDPRPFVKNSKSIQGHLTWFIQDLWLKMPRPCQDFRSALVIEAKFLGIIQTCGESPSFWAKEEISGSRPFTVYTCIGERWVSLCMDVKVKEKSDKEECDKEDFVKEECDKDKLFNAVSLGFRNVLQTFTRSLSQKEANIPAANFIRDWDNVKDKFKFVLEKLMLFFCHKRYYVMGTNNDVIVWIVSPLFSWLNGSFYWLRRNDVERLFLEQIVAAVVLHGDCAVNPENDIILGWSRCLDSLQKSFQAKLPKVGIGYDILIEQEEEEQDQEEEGDEQEEDDEQDNDYYEKDIENTFFNLKNLSRVAYGLFISGDDDENFDAGIAAHYGNVILSSCRKRKRRNTRRNVESMDAVASVITRFPALVQFWWCRWRFLGKKSTLPDLSSFEEDPKSEERIIGPISSSESEILFDDGKSFTINTKILISSSGFFNAFLACPFLQRNQPNPKDDDEKRNRLIVHKVASIIGIRLLSFLQGSFQSYQDWQCCSDDEDRGTFLDKSKNHIWILFECLKLADRWLITWTPMIERLETFFCRSLESVALYDRSMDLILPCLQGCVMVLSDGPIPKSESLVIEWFLFRLQKAVNLGYISSSSSSVSSEIIKRYLHRQLERFSQKRE